MTSTRMESILRQAADRIMKLVDVDRFYVALYDDVRSRLEFPFAMSDGKILETERDPWSPRPYLGSAALPDHVIESGVPLLVEKDLKGWTTANNIDYPLGKLPLSWLGSPMMVGERVIGAIVVENENREGAYGKGGLRLLSTMARQIAIAVENARLYERLDRKIANLRAVNEVGRRLTSGIRLSEQEILELIYEQASLLMDTSNMYIALYDEEEDMVSFGLAMDDGRRVDVEHEKGWGARKAGHGLTEYIIRTKQSYCPADVNEACKTIAPDYIVKIPKSWMGVPMMVGDKVLGVVVLRNDECENVYGEDELEVLQAIAGQAAVAIENARLYAHLVDAYQYLREAQEQRIEAERFAYLGHAADGIAHRINNTIALLPLCIRDIREHLGTVDAVVDSNLEMIARNAQYVLDLAEELQKPSRPSEAGRFDINLLIKEAIHIARPPLEVEVITKLDETLPEIQTKKLLIDVFVELIMNAVEAMTGCAKRVLEIGSRLTEGKYVEVWFTDTGKGIPEEEQERLFELFYTTTEKREPTAGVAKGFGLWWIKTFLAWQGGDISVESQVDAGTTFVVELPLEVQP